MSNRRGPDVSIWQGFMLWQKTKEAGAEFAIIRAGSISQTGELYDDYRLTENAANCDLPRTFYWFFRPNKDPIKQAQYFWALAGGLRHEFPLVADVEITGGLSMTALRASVKAFLDELERLDGQKPIIYTRASFWNPWLGDPDWASDYDVWLARYVTINTADLPAYMTGPWSDGYYKPLSWDEWAIWQYSADGNMRGVKYGAESNSIDLNLMPEWMWNKYMAPDEQIVHNVEVPRDADIIIIHRV